MSEEREKNGRIWGGGGGEERKKRREEKEKRREREEIKEEEKKKNPNIHSLSSPLHSLPFSQDCKEEEKRRKSECERVGERKRERM